MEEIQEIHERNLQWGCIANLIDKIGDEADRLNWDALTDMVADAFAESEKETDNAKLFFIWHQFFFRLLFRVKAMDKPQEFNIVYRDNGDERGFRIVNYDYKMFLFLKSKGLTDVLTNAYCIVPESKLTPAQIKGFEKKVQD